MSRNIAPHREGAAGFGNRFAAWTSFVDRFASRHGLTQVQAASVLADIHSQKWLWSWTDSSEYIRLLALRNGHAVTSERDAAMETYTHHLTPRR